MNLFQQPLTELLSPIEPDAFAHDVYGRRPLHLPGPATRFDALFGWDDLNRLLNLSLSSETSPGLRIFRGGRNFVYKRATENLQGILTQLRQGSTLILENIDKFDARLGRFLDALSDEIGAETRINLYLSYPGTQGYPLHYDTHDFFILQISGRKRWEVYPCTSPAPLQPSPAFLAPDEPVGPEHAPPPADSRLLEVELGPGDVLYVPKGFWHQALAEHEPAMHLTLGMYFKHGLDYLQWLLSELRESPAFRQPLPFVRKQDLPASVQAPSPWQPRIQQLHATFGQLLSDPRLLARFHQASYAGLPRRQAFSLPHQYLNTPAELLHCIAFRKVNIPHYLQQQADGQLELTIARQQLRFAPAARELLAFVLERPAFSRDELLAAFGEFQWAELLEVMLPLVQDGLLIPEFSV